MGAGIQFESLAKKGQRTIRSFATTVGSPAALHRYCLESTRLAPVSSRALYPRGADNGDGIRRNKKGATRVPARQPRLLPYSKYVLSRPVFLEADGYSDGFG